MKAAAAAPQLKVADCRYNVRQMAETAAAAAAEGVRVLIFPELSITGSTCGDLLLHSSLLESAQKALLELAQMCDALDMIIVAGLPLSAAGRLMNCAAVLHRGTVIGVAAGEGARHYYPADEGMTTLRISGCDVPVSDLYACGTMPDFVLGICVGDGRKAAALCGAGATVIAVMTSDCEQPGKAAIRRSEAEASSRELVCGYIRSGAGSGESTTDMVFGGHCLVAECGEVLAEGKPFSGRMAAGEIDTGYIAFERRRQGTLCRRTGGAVSFEMKRKGGTPSRVYPQMPFVRAGDERAEQCGAVLDIQAHALKKRLEHIGCDNVCIGVSGGLDSTLALIAACRAFDLTGIGRERITAVSMPCFGTTDRTRGNAERLCLALGVSARVIDISASVLRHFEDIGHAPDVPDVAFENAQARERTQVLMDISNMQRGIVVGTGDLSELALGWSTYNGDHMSMYCVNGGVPKTLIRHVVRYYSDTCGQPELSEALNDILATPVSPELLPAKNGEIAQKTEELVGPYALHDFFLFHMVGRGCSPKKLFWLACRAFEGVYPADTVKKWLAVFIKRFFTQQFKRSCMPDGPKIVSPGLSPRGDWVMPSDACPTAWLDEVNELGGES